MFSSRLVITLKWTYAVCTFLIKSETGNFIDSFNIFTNPGFFSRNIRELFIWALVFIFNTKNKYFTVDFLFVSWIHCTTNIYYSVLKWKSFGIFHFVIDLLGFIDFFSLKAGLLNVIASSPVGSLLLTVGSPPARRENIKSYIAATNRQKSNIIRIICRVKILRVNIYVVQLCKV